MVAGLFHKIHHKSLFRGVIKSGTCVNEPSQFLHMRRYQGTGPMDTQHYTEAGNYIYTYKGTMGENLPVI